MWKNKYMYLLVVKSFSVIVISAPRIVKAMIVIMNITVIDAMVLYVSKIIWFDKTKKMINNVKKNKRYV